MNPVIIVHGGASCHPDSRIPACKEGVKLAVTAGFKVLQSGGCAVDAVEAAVTALEDNPVFNAGTGSVINTNGEVEMDSLIMDGKDLKSGAVASVQNIKNPIQLAKRVMTQTEHCLLVGSGANQFAASCNIPQVPVEQLITEYARQELERMKIYKNTIQQRMFLRENLQRKDTDHDTVGAVALDSHGNIAFGTSTGGITAKQPGRVGDSPLVGSGGYADNHIGGAIATGHGEAILKMCLSHRILMEMQKGSSTQQSADLCLSLMAQRVGGSGGVVVVSHTGDVAHSFTTTHMPWAYVKDGQLHHGMAPGENFTEEFKSSQ